MFSGKPKSKFEEFEEFEGRGDEGREKESEGNHEEIARAGGGAGGNGGVNRGTERGTAEEGDVPRGKAEDEEDEETRRGGRRGAKVETGKRGTG